MSETATTEGGLAFANGHLRVTNPHDPNSENWLCWRDGYEQARAFANRMPAANAVALETEPPWQGHQT